MNYSTFGGGKFSLPVKAKVLRLVLNEELQSFQVWTFGLSRNIKHFPSALKETMSSFATKCRCSYLELALDLSLWGGTLRIVANVLVRELW